MYYWFEQILHLSMVLCWKDQQPPECSKNKHFVYLVVYYERVVKSLGIQHLVVGAPAESM